jgi:hypothetical protein
MEKYVYVVKNKPYDARVTGMALIHDVVEAGRTYSEPGI